ncbi:hypothetical protein CRG98_043099 [Punica granatum]|uniref:Gnk2-homologous domain-containing protein n=1 Tax=Punica granatum TaxID=22663 RepID=A0A2I0HY02_PUNGR|nr:hypothetical protein CRG98_043099 [Punica granatum]
MKRLKIEHSKKKAYHVFSCAPDLTLLSGTCNGQELHGKNNRKKVDNVLVQVVNNAPDHGYNYYDSSSPSSKPIAYEHAACNGNLSKDDCIWCLVVACDEITLRCSPKSPAGAQVHFQDCRLRYEFYQFED